MKGEKMKTLDKLTIKQKKIVCLGLGSDYIWGNVDNLINEDGSCKITGGQLKIISLGRGNRLYWGNVNDFINKDGSCDLDEDELFKISIARGKKAKVKKINYNKMVEITNLISKNIKEIIGLEKDAMEVRIVKECVMECMFYFLIIVPLMFLYIALILLLI